MVLWLNGVAWWINIRASGAMLLLAWLLRVTIGRRLRVIAVAGSYGKTTTTRAIRAMLGLPPSRWVDANANCFSLVPIALIRGALESRTVVIEVGAARPGQMARYAWALQPSVVVMTCIGTEHVQSFRDLAHLRDEEAAIVRQLRSSGTAVLNADDPNVASMASLTNARIIRFGTQPGLDVVGSGICVQWPRGTRLTVTAGGESHPIETRLVGSGMAHCILAATGAAVAAGLRIGPALAAAAAMPPTPGRMQPVPLDNGAVILRDDYKSTVDTVLAAIDELSRLPAKRRIIVLGDLDMPPHPEREWYRRVGEQVARVADEVLFVGQKHDRYRTGMRRIERTPAQIGAVRTVTEAIVILSPRLTQGDVVLVKGRETQRMTRLVLALQGVPVRCAVESCRMHLTFCDQCPLLNSTGARSTPSRITHMSVTAQRGRPAQDRVP